MWPKTLGYVLKKELFAVDTLDTVSLLWAANRSAVAWQALQIPNSQTPRVERKWGKGWCICVNLYALGDCVCSSKCPHLDFIQSFTRSVPSSVLISACSLQTCPKLTPLGSCADKPLLGTSSILLFLLSVCSVDAGFQWKCSHTANLPLRCISVYAQYPQTLFTVACLAIHQCWPKTKMNTGLK